MFEQEKDDACSMERERETQVLRERLEKIEGQAMRVTLPRGVIMVNGIRGAREHMN
jgi:hypothetical protein